MDLPVVPILTGGVVLLAVNVMVYLDRMNGRSRACQSARDFCYVSFAFFLAGTFALLDLTTHAWIDPMTNVALAVLKATGVGLALTTASALGFCIASRTHL
ncbi:hypothetical protein [Luteibacter sp.]|uniref:hypothetical protein n=1 Tax=Luteibacter sp. TaxID=1886636 RepID=UPI0025C5D8C1|nr:hypothetical protein [Luteibacter sp.]